MVSLHFRCPSGIARGLGPVDFVPAVFPRPCTRYCGEIPWELKVDGFRQQRADVPVRPYCIAPAGSELIEQDAERGAGAVREGANKGRGRFIVADVLRYAGGTFTRQLHGAPLSSGVW